MGGPWLNGKTDGIDWSDYVITNRILHGVPSRMNVPEKRTEQGNSGPSHNPEIAGGDPAPAIAKNPRSGGVFFARNRATNAAFGGRVNA